MRLLAFDIGGANLKAADGLDFCASQHFPLWRRPGELSAALESLAAEAPAADRWVATMTGELADCFTTKAEGVGAIVEALVRAAAGREVLIYLTDGRLVPPAVAIAEPLRAAAANWHALARFAGRYVRGDCGLVVDIGSTTTDVIPLVCGWPVTAGQTDPERLVSGELVYSGVERSPICALAAELPWSGRMCPTAAEVFATTWDVYLTLEDLPEEPASLHTADGRPATRACALDRLARQICADRTLFNPDDAQAAARAVAGQQHLQIARAVQAVLWRLRRAPQTVILSGRGEFLARRVIESLGLTATVVSLGARLGAEKSRAAAAFALAVLAMENLPGPDAGRLSPRVAHPRTASK